MFALETENNITSVGPISLPLPISSEQTHRLKSQNYLKTKPQVMSKLYTIVPALIIDLINAVQLHFFPGYQITKKVTLQPIFITK